MFAAQGRLTDSLYTGPNRDDIVYVKFPTGPLGIQQALDANAGEPNAILASGWGAANASLLVLRDRSDLDQTVFILDNDVARRLTVGGMQREHLRDPRQR